VQDFSHIRPTTPSPNWSVMRDEDRVRNWSMLTAIERGSGEEVGRVLDVVLPHPSLDGSIAVGVSQLSN
jgi:hypothetical protein